MKRIGLVACAAVFALSFGAAFAEDMDIRSLQAKLAAQEARLNDLQAKMNTSNNAGTPEGIVSMRKNAVVTVGGTVNTRYFMRSAEVKSRLNVSDVNDPAGGMQPGFSDGGVMRKVADTRRGDLRVSDAKLNLKIDVSDNFDAYLQVDLQDAGRTAVSGLAQAYWVRWKNICNSGFGVLIGRNNLVFGGVEPVGLIESFGKAAGTGDTYAGLWDAEAVGAYTSGGYEGMFALNGFTPTRPMWDYSRTTQITPYWESQDGKIKTELSFMQSVDTINGTTRTYRNGTGDDRSINAGLGTMSFRLTVNPIEGLKVVASVLNMRSNFDYDTSTFGAGAANQGGSTNFNLGGNQTTAKNNFVTHLGVQYTPTFFNRLTLWTEWVHGWNNSWVENLDSDTLTLGALFKITDKLSGFGRYEWMAVDNSDAINWNKARGWASYVGATYALGYGVNLEAGWRHENVKYKNAAGLTHTKMTTDTVYGHLGFAF